MHVETFFFFYLSTEMWYNHFHSIVVGLRENKKCRLHFFFSFSVIVQFISMYLFIEFIRWKTGFMCVCLFGEQRAATIKLDKDHSAND